MKRYPDEHLIESPRLCWYNPKLDPALAHKMTPEMVRAINEGTYDDGTEKQGGPLITPDEWHEPNLVSSLCADGLHRPALDVDFPHNPVVVQCIADAVELINPIVVASTGGNCHVYCVEPALTLDAYTEFLFSLGEWLEDRYVCHSVNRGQTLLRLPGIPKLHSMAVEVSA